MDSVERRAILEKIYKGIYANGNEVDRKLMDNYYKCGIVLETNIVGVTFTEHGQNLLKWFEDTKTLYSSIKVSLVREPDNKFDKNAIKVILGVEYSSNVYHVGYINKGLARFLAYLMDNDFAIKAEVSRITGGFGMNYGMIINYRIEERE